MPNATKKIKNYAATIECNIINLMFELLDIINSKTETLRYLMELYLQVKTAAVLRCKDKKENDESPKLPLYDQTASDSGIAELYNRDELFKRSVEEMSDLYKSSLSVIEEDKDTDQEKHSLPPSESKSKEIQRNTCKSEDAIVGKARRFIDELVEFALIKTEKRRKHLIKRLEETVSREKSNLFEEINGNKYKNKVTKTDNVRKEIDYLSISSKASKADSFSSNHSVHFINNSQANEDCSINTNRLRSNTAIKFENTTFRTIIDPKSHRLYHENNFYQREDGLPHEGSFSDIYTNVNVRFESTQLVSNPKLHKDLIQDDEIQKYEKEIEKVQENKLFPEVFSQLSDFLPHVTRSSSIVSLRGTAEGQRGEKRKKKKLRKQKKSNVSKVKLDPITYRRICNAILNSVNKKGIAKNMAQENFKRAVERCPSCDTECRRAVKSCSNFEFNSIVDKMIPNFNTDMKKFFLSRARVPHPWNEDIIVCGKDVFK